jgi:phage repressor protein C with HTH and peptisase S24 domain
MLPTTLEEMRIRPNWRELLQGLVAGQKLAPICRRAKLNPTYLRDVFERHQTPSLEKAEKLSAALGVDLTDWFILPSGQHDKADKIVDLPRFDNMFRDIPVRGAGEAGKDGAFHFNGADPIDFVKRPSRLHNVSHAYALYVTGDSMFPWRKQGGLVYVHEKQQPMVGDHVVIQIKPDAPGEAPRAYIKRLEKRTSAHLVVSQYNPPLRMTFPIAKVVSVHRILEWEELLGV